MKPLRFLPIIFLLLCTITASAQQDYNVNGTTYSLKTEVEGPLTLLWNSIDGEYRYFSKKGNNIEELTNTKQNGDYQEEYKKTLQQQTADATISVDKVKLTLPSLHAFFAKYNKMKDPNFSESKSKVDLQVRLGAFAGVSNSVYTANPTNALQPVAGVEMELTDNVKLKRHSVVLRFKKTFESSEYKYSASQLSLNYRFKFVKTPKLDAYANVKFAALTFFNKETTILYNGLPPEVVKKSGSDFNAPLTFGIGADYKLGNGYVTFNYNDIVGITVDHNGEFPVDFTLGYKFNL